MSGHTRKDYTDTAPDSNRSNSPISGGRMLRVNSLRAYPSTIGINSIQKEVLDEKKEQLQKALSKKRDDMERELTYQTQYSGGTPPPPSGMSESSTENVGYERSKLDEKRDRLQDELSTLQQDFQSRLDNLNLRFQREFTDNPPNQDPDVTMSEGGPDSGYLARTVGKALETALAEVAVKRPCDPIEYLSYCLRKYSQNIQLVHQDAIMDLKLRLEKDDAEREVNRTIKLQREANVIQLEDQRRKEMFKTREDEVEQFLEDEKVKEQERLKEEERLKEAERLEQEQLKEQEEEERKKQEEDAENDQLVDTETNNDENEIENDSSDNRVDQNTTDSNESTERMDSEYLNANNRVEDNSYNGEGDDQAKIKDTLYQIDENETDP